MNPDYQTLLFERRGAIASITLNRPEAANSLDMTMARELLDAAIRCDQDAELRAVLLTGNGKMFSAGGDLKAFAAMGDTVGAGLKQLTVYFHATISRLTRMGKPLIVAVNGTAAGAGVSLAAAGDITLGAESARFTLAYTAAGLSPDGSASYFLPRLIGLRRTQELIFSNRRLSADEAADWGLITRVVADEALAAEAETLTRQLASGPTRAYGKVKQLLAESFQQSLETQMELEARAIAELAAGADGREGLAAFAGKRQARFGGR